MKTAKKLKNWVFSDSLNFMGMLAIINLLLFCSTFLILGKVPEYVIIWEKIWICLTANLSLFAIPIIFNGIIDIVVGLVNIIKYAVVNNN